MQEDRRQNPTGLRESRVRAASLPAGPSPIRRSRLRAHVLLRSTHHRRFKEFQCAFTIRVQTRLNAQRYRKHGPHRMPDGGAKHDWNAERPQNSRANFANARSPGHGRFALWKISQHNPADSFKLSRLLQVHQDAIHLVRPHRAVFENQDRIPGVQFPWRSDGGFQKSHTTTQNSSQGLTGQERFALQPQLPATFRSAYRLKKRILIVTLARTGSRVKPGGNHGAIESNPFALLPEKDLQRCKVAESDHALETS